MAYLRGEAREQTTMFPVTLDELIPSEHMWSGDGGVREPVEHGEVRLRASRAS
jgi:hypothetical protein